MNPSYSPGHSANKPTKILVQPTCLIRIWNGMGFTARSMHLSLNIGLVFSRILCPNRADVAYCYTCRTFCCLCVLGTPVSPAKRLSWTNNPYAVWVRLARGPRNNVGAHWHHLANTIEWYMRRWRRGLGVRILWRLLILPFCCADWSFLTEFN